MSGYRKYRGREISKRPHKELIRLMQKREHSMDKEPGLLTTLKLKLTKVTNNQSRALSWMDAGLDKLPLKTFFFEAIGRTKIWTGYLNYVKILVNFQCLIFIFWLCLKMFPL